MSALERRGWNMSEIATLLKDTSDAVMDWLSDRPCTDPARVWLMINRLDELVAAATELAAPAPEASANIILLANYRRDHRRGNH